jgi:hypothetical protein
MRKIIASSTVTYQEEMTYMKNAHNGAGHI